MKKVVKISKKYPKQESKIYKKVTFHKLGWLEWVTIIIGIWFLVKPEPYHILLGILLVIPVAGILINGFGRPSIASLVDIDEVSEKYDVADFIDAAAIFLLIRVCLDYKFLSISSLILPGLIGFGLMVLLLFFTHERIAKSHRNRTWVYLSLVFNIFLYSYSATFAINCAYDDSTPVAHPTEVLDKIENPNSRRLWRRYEITIAPWTYDSKQKKIYVPESYFKSLEVGDTTEVNVKKGLLNIPWYYLY